MCACVQVVSVCFVPSPYLAALASFRDSAIVIDCGFTESRVVAVFSNTVVLPSLVYSGLGSVSVLQVAMLGVKEALTAAGGGDAPTVSWAFVEDVVVRGCFVAPVDARVTSYASYRCSNETVRYCRTTGLWFDCTGVVSGSGLYRCETSTSW